jgi:hypothetical protein
MEADGTSVRPSENGVSLQRPAPTHEDVISGHYRLRTNRCRVLPSRDGQTGVAGRNHVCRLVLSNANATERAGEAPLSASELI